MIIGNMKIYACMYKLFIVIKYIYCCINIYEYSAFQFLEEVLKQADTSANVTKVLNIHSKI